MYSTLALLTEPRRLDARLSDVHFIEPPGTLAYTLVFRKQRSANTERTKQLKHVDRGGFARVGCNESHSGFLYVENF